ncbi:MAG: acyl-CoA dehydrogenase [Dehalococcoidia bacterium]|nr:acyl-CoA dehydrogenase [Dehalococcoidia bacterium]
MVMPADERRRVVEGLLQFARKEAEPLEAEIADVTGDPRQLYAPDGRFHPRVVEARREIRRRAAKAGYYAMCVPAGLGGGGLGRLVFFEAWDALTRRYGPHEVLAYFAVAHWATGPSAMWLNAEGWLASEVLPKVLSAEIVGCFCLSEPEAGTDAWGIRTRAARAGDTWRISGSKQWITNGPDADYAVVLAVTDRQRADARRGGVTAFFVPTNSPGFRVESVIRVQGELGGNEAIIGLSNVEAAPRQVLGREGEGFRIAMYSVNQGRLYNAARSVGMGTWAVERAVAYARERRTFGVPIAEHQAVQLLLADTAAELYAARAAGLRLAADNDDDGVDINRKDAAITKYVATNAAFRAFDRATQVFGGMGVTNEVGLYQGLNLFRILRIADGTDEILRTTVARELAKGDLAL